MGLERRRYDFVGEFMLKESRPMTMRQICGDVLFREYSGKGIPWLVFYVLETRHLTDVGEGSHLAE